MSAAAIARVGPQGRALPGGWRWVRLREICGPDRQIVAAQDPRVKALPYLSLEHIEAATGRILKAPGSTEEQARSTTFAFDRRHVLYGKLRPYLNKVALPPFAGRCTTELIPLLPGDQVDRAFLSWVLRRRETVEAAMRDRTGSRMPRASLEELLRLEVPLPPLPEQRRIVAVLDEHMGVIEKGRAAAHAQLEAARALPGAYLRQVFSSSEADQWPKRRLGEIAEIVSGITLGRRLGERLCRANQSQEFSPPRHWMISAWDSRVTLSRRLAT